MVTTLALAVGYLAMGIVCGTLVLSDQDVVKQLRDWPRTRLGYCALAWALILAWPLAVVALGGWGLWSFFDQAERNRRGK